MKSKEAIEAKLWAMRAKCKAEDRQPTAEEVTYCNDLIDQLEEIEGRAANPIPPGLLGNPTTNPTTSPNGPFKSAGEQLLAIRDAGTPGGKTDPRLHEVRAATGMSEGVGSDGGFLLQQDFSNQILGDSLETGKLAKLCSRFQISGNSNSIKIPAVDETSRASTRFGGTVGYWTAEAAEKTASKPKTRQLELNLNKMVVLTYVTDELLQDAQLCEQFVRMSATSEIGFQVDDAIINGTGAGRPLGIVNAGCLVSQAAEGGQAANSVIMENIDNMYSRVINPENSVWCMNADVLPQIFGLSRSVGTGGSTMFLANAVDGPGLKLMGLPIVITEQCGTVGDLGDLILANFKDGYILAEKGGIQADMSIHVRFIYDESVFRFVLRLDGQPVRASALTPYKGTITQGHFVALAAR
jgi:HK97 family phage major capsid protein